MTNINEIKSPFLRKTIEQRGIKDDLVTDLLIVERYLRQPELTNSIVMLMLRAAVKDHPLEAEIVGRELKLGRAITEPEMKGLQVRVEVEVAQRKIPVPVGDTPGKCADVLVALF